MGSLCIEVYQIYLTEIIISLNVFIVMTKVKKRGKDAKND